MVRMTDARTQRALEIMDSIRQVLVQDWNPIGVNENRKLHDEYDSYIAPVYRLLTESASAEDIAKFLYIAEHELGGPAKSTAHLLPIAHKLLAIEVTLGPNAA